MSHSAWRPVDVDSVTALLYVDQSAVGVIEAKPQGASLSGVEWQSAMYAEGLPAEVRLKAVTTGGRLPFVFEASRRRR
jgi:type I restriction enzyme, R subunit